MELAERFLRADTKERLRLVLGKENRNGLCRVLGDAAYDELRKIAEECNPHLNAAHLGAADPKNVIFVPGIMGSLLMSRSKGGIWWLDVRTREFIDNLALSPDGKADADPTNQISPITVDCSYTPFLSKALVEEGLNHEIFPYDWRKPLSHSAQSLRDLVLKLHSENGGKAVHVVAHSMGGMMVRNALMEFGSELWPKLGRIILIGTPHYGSTAIAGYLKNHLWGYELMAILGLYLSRPTLRSLWGVISLLPAPCGIYPGTRESDQERWAANKSSDPYVHPCVNFDLYQADKWKLDLSGRETAGFQAILDYTSVTYRRLYTWHVGLSQEARDKMVVIAGVGIETLYRLAYAPGFLGLWEKMEKIFREDRGDANRIGDGRVPLASARLEHVSDIRFVKGVHGSLTNIPSVYEDVFRCLKGEPMQLPTTVAEALSNHLGETQAQSEAPHLDNSSLQSNAPDESGLWGVDKVTPERIEELEKLLAAESLPEFGRLRIL